MLTPEEVRHVARLANLPLTEAEVEQFRSQLSEVLDYFKILDEVPVGNVPPTFQVTGATNVFRKDDPNARGPAPGLAPSQALRNAPLTHKQYFAVPPVLESKKSK